MTYHSPAIRELCVIGHPSRYGGADTELDHQIRCWQAMGVEVHICHTDSLTDDMKSLKLEDRGCVYLASRDWPSLNGLHCISFCNRVFLRCLPDIYRHARTTTFVNCMTYNFEMEIEMQSRGFVDFHLYQTQHAYHRISSRLAGHGKYRPVFFSPYFETTEFPFIEDRPADRFRFGRISRADLDKFGAHQLWIYETMTSPVPKEGMILGWTENVEAKYGGRPKEYIRTLAPREITQQDFYNFCDCLIMTSENLENLPRVGLEAFASGTLLVVDDRGGWRILVEDGISGWLCADENEFVYKASRSAFETDERRRMCRAARKRLESLAGMQVAMDAWDQVFRRWHDFKKV